MALNEDILSELPTPNDAEPSSLRRDIADELLDHLECAARRESLKSPDPNSIEHRVLSRFGNPRTIARKLWFDAMKEKLMMQKLTLAIVSLVAVASLAACGLMWSLARDIQAANTELLSQLSAIANREPEGPNLMEWVPLKIQVVKNDKAKTPAEGFHVQIRGHAISEAETATLNVETDESGIAEFGLVRPGSYTGSIVAPWGEALRLGMVVKPGSPHVEKIIAPAGPPEAHRVKPAVQWPKELEGKDIAVFVKIERSDETKIGEQTWKPQGSEQYLLIRPDGRFATYSAVSYHRPEHYSRNQDVIVKHGRVGFLSNPEIFEASFPWKGEQVRISELKVVKLQRKAEFPEQGDSLVWLSESAVLNRYIPGHLNSFESRLYEKSPDQIAKEGAQEWIIELSESDLWYTRATLVIEQFSEIPPGVLINSVARYFQFLDQNRNLEISEEEVAEENARKELLENYGPFPISFKTFIEKYVKPYQEDEP